MCNFLAEEKGICLWMCVSNIHVVVLCTCSQVKIDNAVNAKLMTEPEPQYATVTIVGINDMPPPRYVASMQSIIGAVCGAATAVPFALLSARFIRSLRRGHGESSIEMLVVHIVGIWRHSCCILYVPLLHSRSVNPRTPHSFVVRRCKC